MNLTVIHGTVWDKPFFDSPEMIEQAMVFNDLTPEHDTSKYGAVYFADNENVVDFFAKEKIADEDNQVLAQIKVELTLNKVFEIDFTPDISVIHDNVLYLWPEERNLLYVQLKREGYDAVITQNEYRSGGLNVSDIAVINPDTITPTLARIKLGDEYTPWMNEQEAKAIMSKWANDELNMSADLDNSNDYDDFRY